MTLFPRRAQKQGWSGQGTVALAEPGTREQMSPLLRSSLRKPVLWERDPLLSAWGAARDEREGVS